VEAAQSPTAWRRSSRCASSNCVEVARAGDTLAVRDSAAADGPVLTFGSVQWGNFLAAVRSGEFDLR
jgi:hypothetical protein